VPTVPLPDAVAALLARPNPAVMANAARGRPAGHRGDLVSARGRRAGPAGPRRRPRAAARLRADPRVSLTALAEGDWYTHVSVQGRVESIVADEGLLDIDRLSRHYTGHEYPDRVRPRVSVRVRIATWHGWGDAARE